jgi:hypothetical protein
MAEPPAYSMIEEARGVIRTAGEAARIVAVAALRAGVCLQPDELIDVSWRRGGARAASRFETADFLRTTKASLSTHQRVDAIQEVAVALEAAGFTSGHNGLCRILDGCGSDSLHVAMRAHPQAGDVGDRPCDRFSVLQVWIDGLPVIDNISGSGPSPLRLEPALRLFRRPERAHLHLGAWHVCSPSRSRATGGGCLRVLNVGAIMPADSAEDALGRCTKWLDHMRSVQSWPAIPASIDLVAVPLAPGTSLERSALTSRQAFWR